jgi:GT2 family glycosyltransferase
VDNAPADERSREVVAAYSQFRYVLEPRPGLDWARNRGIAEAQGEIIAYTDDDVRVDPLWVQNIVKAFTLSPSVMCVTGLVAPAERETAAQHLFENYGGFGRGFKRRIHSREEPKNSWYFPLNAGWFGTGCNMAYRRVFFDQHGPFDEAMDVGTLTHGGGDLEMFYRVLRANYTLVYEPEALVWHYHRREYAKLRQQLYDFGRGYYAFLTRCFMSDPPMRRTIVRWGLHWYRRWFLHRMRYRPKIGRKLVVLEAIGALQGPFYYFRARLQAKKITRLYGRVMKWPTNVKIK